MILDDYSPGDGNINKNIENPESLAEHKICDLNQQLPGSDEWEDFLSNYNNKF